MQASVVSPHTARASRSTGSGSASKGQRDHVAVRVLPVPKQVVRELVKDHEAPCSRAGAVHDGAADEHSRRPRRQRAWAHREPYLPPFDVGEDGLCRVGNDGALGQAVYLVERDPEDLRDALRQEFALRAAAPIEVLAQHRVRNAERLGGA